MTTSEILNEFPRLSVLVVGDICLDRWCTYDPSTAEPSRETGIPRLGVIRTDVTPGAGGTVANNLVALGAGHVAVLGAIADDGFGHELTGALRERSVDTSLLVKAPGLQTFTYTKLINGDTGEEDRPRVDFINTRELGAETQRELEKRLRGCLEDFDTVIIADQAETSHGGVVTGGLRDAIEDLARRHPRKIFWADSRSRTELFRGVIVKPNQEEAEAACQRLFGKTDFDALREHIQAPVLLVTHGPEGVLLVTGSGRQWVRTRPVARPVDICGAGDSFTAGASMALRVTSSPEQAAWFGNLVASITIGKRGTGTASPAEVLAAGEGHGV